MPRTARLDIQGLLQHVIVRGIWNPEGTLESYVRYWAKKQISKRNSGWTPHRPAVEW